MGKPGVAIEKAEHRFPELGEFVEQIRGAGPMSAFSVIPSRAVMGLYDLRNDDVSVGAVEKIGI